MSRPIVDISRALGCRLGRAPWPHVIETGNRGRDAVASRRRAASVPATAALAVFTVPLPAVALLAVARFAVPGFAPVRFAVEVFGHVGALGDRGVRFSAHPGNALTDQLFDRRDALRVGGGHHGNGGGGAAGACGAGGAGGANIRG